MADFATLGYAACALSFGVLGALLLAKRQARFQTVHLFVAVAATAVWATLAALHFHDASVELDYVWGAEVVRNLAWMFFLLALLRPLAEGSRKNIRVLAYARMASLGLAGVLLVLLGAPASLKDILPSPAAQREMSLIGQLLFAVMGMAFTEQLLRNTPEEQRWGIKYLCFGLGVLFVYDFYLYTDALLFQRIDPDIWSARGAVNVMAVPLIAVTVVRNPDRGLPVFLSRRMVFHSTALLGAGIYMLLMAVAGYYIKHYGGEWGTVLQITFLFGAIMVLIALLFSGQLRSRAKVFLNKHFFSYRYDYREEWLRLMSLLAGQHSELPIIERVIWALSEIVDSPGGILFLADDKGSYRAVGQFNLARSDLPPIPPGHPLMRYMEENQWVVDLNEWRERESVAQDLEVPAWMGEDVGIWLLVPLLQDERMLGFVMLIQPRAVQTLNWENLDLLKTAGMQSASYLALYQAAEALADARQFEGFNRLSAFVIHDLKNLIAQLSLVAKNAARHKHNPEFVDDAVKTIENSVEKMNRLMVQLRTADATGRDANKRIDLREELQSLVDSRRSASPRPVFRTEVDSAIVLGQEDRLGAVFGHVLQNALDATPADGSVLVLLRLLGDQAVVEIRDTGSGMDADFIQNRLFRPFDSTKGLTGMGIGAYECREVVQAAGGQVVVDSQAGKGTVFRIMLPLAAG
jgi:putative PEP-CTERM system histidine kinase